MKWLLVLITLFISSASHAQILGPGDQYELWRAGVCKIYKCVNTPTGVLLWTRNNKESLHATPAEVVAAVSELSTVYATAPVTYAVNHAADRELEKLYRTNASLDYLGNICKVTGAMCGVGATALSLVTLGWGVAIGGLCSASTYDCLHKIDNAKIKVTMRIDHIKQACAKDDASCYEEITGDTGSALPPPEDPDLGPRPRPGTGGVNPPIGGVRCHNWQIASGGKIWPVEEHCVKF